MADIQQLIELAINKPLVGALVASSIVASTLGAYWLFRYNDKKNTALATKFLFAVSTIGAAVLFILVVYQHGQNYKFAARKHLILTYVAKSSGCIVVVVKKTTDCTINLSPNSKEDKLLQIRIQMPSGEFAGSGIQFGSIGEGGVEEINHASDYLWNREREFFGLKDDDDGPGFPVPAIIYSKYENGGKVYYDRSAYWIYYRPLFKSSMRIILPVSIIYCGNISDELPDPDFIVDPVAVSRVGFADKPSNTIGFDCGSDDAFWLKAPPGVYSVDTELETKRPYNPTVPRRLSAGAIRLQSSQKRLKISYKIVSIRG